MNKHVYKFTNIQGREVVVQASAKMQKSEVDFLMEKFGNRVVHTVEPLCSDVVRAFSTKSLSDPIWPSCLFSQRFAISEEIDKWYEDELIPKKCSLNTVTALVSLGYSIVKLPYLNNHDADMLEIWAKTLVSHPAGTVSVSRMLEEADRLRECEK